MSSVVRDIKLAVCTTQSCVTHERGLSWRAWAATWNACDGDTVGQETGPVLGQARSWDEKSCSSHGRFSRGQRRWCGSPGLEWLMRDQRFISSRSGAKCAATTTAGHASGGISSSAWLCEFSTFRPPFHRFWLSHHGSNPVGAANPGTPVGFHPCLPQRSPVPHPDLPVKAWKEKGVTRGKRATTARWLWRQARPASASKNVSRCPCPSGPPMQGEFAK